MTSNKALFRRPADLHYDDMDSLLQAAETERNESRQVRVRSSDVLFKYDEDDESLRVGLGDLDALPLSHYSLTQVSSMSKIPVPMIERLYGLGERELIVDNLNALFPRASTDMKTALIRDFSDEEGNVVSSQVRAVNGSAYSRLWDHEVFSEVDDWLLPRGFTPDLPFMPAGAMRSQLMYGDTTALYRGDQTSFGLFFVEDVDSALGDSLGGLVPGVMVWNSEVGARSFGFHTFYYHRRSGSVIIWTPSNHKRKRFVHRGNIQRGFREYLRTLEDTAENFEGRFASDVELFADLAQVQFASDDDAAVQKLNDQYDVAKPDARAIVAASHKACNSYGLSLSVWRIALGMAWEAGVTSRAESMVDKSMVATKLLRRNAAKFVTV